MCVRERVEGLDSRHRVQLEVCARPLLRERERGGGRGREREREGGRGRDRKREGEAAREREREIERERGS